MKIFSFHNFNFIGSAQLPQGEFVAVGIAPGSWVDTCKIGAHVLGPRAVVPYAPTATAIRGLRTRSADGGQGTAFAEDQLDFIELLLYEKCDLALGCPGPRAPVIVYGKIDETTLGTVAGLPSLLMRIPFFGRRQAAIQVTRRNNIANDTNIVVRGLKYVPRDIYAGGAGATVAHPIADEVTDTIWKGTGAAPLSVITGFMQPAGTGTQTSTGNFVNTNVQLGDTIYVGGVDNQENYDELEVYVYGAVGAATEFLYGVGEAFGERVL